MVDLHKVFSGSYPVLIFVEQEPKYCLNDFIELQAVIIFE